MSLNPCLCSSSRQYSSLFVRSVQPLFTRSSFSGAIPFVHLPHRHCVSLLAPALHQRLRRPSAAPIPALANVGHPLPSLCHRLCRIRLHRNTAVWPDSKRPHRRRIRGRLRQQLSIRLILQQHRRCPWKWGSTWFELKARRAGAGRAHRSEFQWPIPRSFRMEEFVFT